MEGREYRPQHLVKDSGFYSRATNERGVIVV